MVLSFLSLKTNWHLVSLACRTESRGWTPQEWSWSGADIISLLSATSQHLAFPGKADPPDSATLSCDLPGAFMALLNTDECP